MENRKKVLNLLGLATRAGKTASGEFMTEKAIKSGKAYLVIVSEEASDNTKKMFENSCAYYKVFHAELVQGSRVPVRHERRAGTRDGKRDESVSGRFGFRFCKGVKREVR